MNIQLKAPRLRERKSIGEEVHIWLASLDAPVLKFQGMLAADEQDRAERFHFEKDRNRFIVRRGILRILLGCYLGVEPESVRLSQGQNGKPIVAGADGERLRFNLSHSENMAIYAFSGDREIGVDIEQMRDNIEMTQLVERFFSARERAEWRTLPGNQKKETFFNGWTRKEAFTKATGDGLSVGLDTFDVSIAPGEPARLMAINGDEKAASGWSIHDLKTTAGFAAALAIEGKTGAINIRRWAS